MSHFGPDQAFKRVFSGFGTDMHHHGHGDNRSFNNSQISQMTFDNGLFKMKSYNEGRKSPSMPSMVQLDLVL